MAKLEKQSDKKGMYLFWCPGCKCAHYIATAKNDCGFPVWNWNGDNENPTVATYAKEDGVLIRVTASGKTREDALTAMQPVVTKIAEILAGKIAWVKEEV